MLHQTNQSILDPLSKQGRQWKLQDSVLADYLCPPGQQPHATVSTKEISVPNHHANTHICATNATWGSMQQYIQFVLSTSIPYLPALYVI